jgi:hypothetical protein
MKKLLITVALALAAVVQTNAQGLVDFRNRITGTLDQPVFMTDGTTRVGEANYVAQLWYAATETGSYAPVAGAASVFRTGTGAGYWNAGADSTRTLAGIVAGTTAWLQVRVWNSTLGADYATAAAAGPGSFFGTSANFSVTAGGTPPVGAPLTPAAMLGFTSFSLVPEPSTIALGVLGVAGLLFIRRRK